MRVRVLKDFSNSYNGNVVAGQICELPSDAAIQMQSYGLVELIRTSEDVAPPKHNGQAKQSVSSPAAQASHQIKPITSEASVGLSQSTPATSSPLGVTPSTPQTEYGGSDTTKKRQKPRKSGAATRGAKKPTA